MASSSAPTPPAGLLDQGHPAGSSAVTPSQPQAWAATSPQPTPVSAAPAPALTPLQLRQWQRGAQRSVRLALTAFKAGRTQLQEATEQGTAAATQLTNALLTAQYVPAMQLPEALQSVQGLKPAAVRKLGRRQQQHLQALSVAVQQAAAAVTAMEGALAGARVQLGDCDAAQGPGTGQALDGPSATSSDSRHPLTVGESQALASFDATSQHPQASPGTPAAAPSPAGDCSTAAGGVHCSRTPVFHILTLPQAVEMLQRVVHMHQQDLQLKRGVLDSFAAEVLGGESAGAGAARKQQEGVAGDAAEVLRRRLTVLITCWLSKPHVDEDEALQLLQVLTDEMTGF